MGYVRGPAPGTRVNLMIRGAARPGDVKLPFVAQRLQGKA